MTLKTKVLISLRLPGPWLATNADCGGKSVRL